MPGPRQDVGSETTIATPERERVEDRQRLLAEASATLAESLDYDETLATVAHLAVPRLADWCMVGVVEHETLRTVAFAHVDPSKEPLFKAMRPANLDALGDIARVVRGSQSVVVAEVTEAMLAPGTEVPLPPGEAGTRIANVLRSLGLSSLMAVPLQARKRTLGALVLARTHPDRRYGSADLSVAEDLARRCAMAIDNALLYRTAQDAIHARDEFLSIASHELRTPLTSMLLRLETLERGLSEGRTVDFAGPHGAVSVLLRQSKRLSNLVDQLLDVSRIRRADLELELEDVDLAEVLREVATRLEADVARAGCSLSLLVTAPATGRWDRMRIEQVVTNLLSNAIKFAHGTTIDAAVNVDPKCARLVVRDQGIGISGADQARIFARFERASSSRHFAGLGLGLYITRKIVEAHGGTIHLESAPGAGSTFTVELPR
jgi:signal transduction histidine kinase